MMKSYSHIVIQDCSSVSYLNSFIRKWQTCSKTAGKTHTTKILSIYYIFSESMNKYWFMQLENTEQDIFLASLHIQQSYCCFHHLNFFSSLVPSSSMFWIYQSFFFSFFCWKQLHEVGLMMRSLNKQPVCSHEKNPMS